MVWSDHADLNAHCVYYTYRNLEYCIKDIIARPDQNEERSDSVFNVWWRNRQTISSWKLVKEISENKKNNSQKLQGFLLKKDFL